MSNNKPFEWNEDLAIEFALLLRNNKEQSHKEHKSWRDSLGEFKQSKSSVLDKDVELEKVQETGIYWMNKFYNLLNGEYQRLLTENHRLKNPNEVPYSMNPPIISKPDKEGNPFEKECQAIYNQGIDHAIEIVNKNSYLLKETYYCDYKSIITSLTSLKKK